jgi:dipeptidase D
MTSELSNLEPKNLWDNFTQICAIPHPSKKEQKLVKFMQEFGNKLGLETIIDEVGNVIIKKPATEGMENHKGVVLQAHLDMVPQKNSDVTHDFEKDPIQAYVDGEWVTAKDTTLGADNGIGVAAIMAILQAKDLGHGPIEALFTVDEEAGMNGAFGFKKGILQGDILLNLDTEVDGEFFIGCAGGVNTNIKLKYSEVPKVKNTIAFKLTLSGLKGGHSGVDIHLGRGNANKIIARLLWETSDKFIPQEQENDFINFVKTFTNTIKDELSTADPGLKITVDKTNGINSVMDKNIQDQLLNAIYVCPNGVLTMSKEIPGLVETSTNLACLKVANGNVDILTSQRSSLASLKTMAANMVGTAFKLIDAEVEYSSDYPGWKPNPNSIIVKIMQRIYQEKYGEAPKITAIHAGLECGLLGDRYPNLDMISFGPTIMNPHSPDEKVNIASVAKFWDLLVETLKNI